ncbi:MAG: efflux RND transporter permease subunit [Pseudomonadota bacterium]
MQRFEKFCEELVFNNRPVVLALFALITGLLVWQAAYLRPDTNLKKMLPLDHPYIENLFKYKDDLGLGNDVQIAVEHLDGDIFDPEYLDVVNRITDEVSTMDGVDTVNVKSVWTANVRWTEVTEEGFQGGEVIPGDYDGSPASLEKLRANILRSGQVGRLFADDFRSSIVYVPLLEADAQGEGGVDYRTFPGKLEEIRDKYQSDKIRIHVVGFAKKMGDLIDGVRVVLLFGLCSLLITAIILYVDLRCLRSVGVICLCSVVAVFWQLGLLRVLGYGLDPYSVLVPFLVFAIAVSHGVQMVNAIGVESQKGSDRLLSARGGFRALFIAGIVALVSDAVGFGTLYIIDIGVIRELAVAAGIGVALVIFTNLVLHPVLMSYVGITPSAIEYQREQASKPSRLWQWFALAVQPKVAGKIVLIAVLGYAVGIAVGWNQQIGDLDRGAPELWPDPCAEEGGQCGKDYRPESKYRYNYDVNFITDNYSVSADVLVVMVETPPDACNNYQALQRMDDLQWALENTNGVQSTVSIASATKYVNAALNEGNLKWYVLSRDQYALNNAMQRLPSGLFNVDCSLAPLIVFLDDHKADTLKRATGVVEAFAREHDDPAVARFLLASGNAGIEAATNEAIQRANNTMLVFVYAVVIVLVWGAFRSWRAVVCLIVPLGLTSALCTALMVVLGIGVKVATLPVVALGVGIGVDYGIYIYSRMKQYLQDGMDLETAYLETLKSTGKAVWFTGLTLAIGVITWAFSPIKFQADMGILLTFMFVWNMVGALTLLPALAHYLLRSEVRKSG